jgi:hypothetical protein
VALLTALQSIRASNLALEGTTDRSARAALVG